MQGCCVDKKQENKLKKDKEVLIMKMRKFMAVAMAATMVVGNGVVALADDANGATGTGTAFAHVDQDIISVTLPTTSAVANVFNYYVDPERLINDSGKLATGSSAVSVEGNEDGVYFRNAGSSAQNGTPSSTIAADTNQDYNVTVSDLATNAEYKYDGSKWQVKTGDDTYEDTTVTITVTESDGATPGTLAANDVVTVSGAVAAVNDGYSSSSDAVSFEGKNSVDVDVSVTAAVTATAGGKDIALVANESALSSATSPALLMQLKVGDSDAVAITSSGGSASAVIEGKENNFELVPTNSNDGYEYKLKGTLVDSWDSTTVQLVGKTNEKDVPNEGITAPEISLTWSVAKHEGTSGDTAPTITGATRVTGAAYDYTADYTRGGALVLTAQGLSAATKSDDGSSYATSSKVTVNSSAGTATIANMWSSASVGDYRYLKLTIGSTDYIVRLTLK